KAGGTEGKITTETDAIQAQPVHVHAGLRSQPVHHHFQGGFPVGAELELRMKARHARLTRTIDGQHVVAAFQRGTPALEIKLLAASVETGVNNHRLAW